MAYDYETNITPAYMNLRCLYLPAAVLKGEKLTAGKTTVFLWDDDDFTVEGTLNSQGYLSGMAKLYHRLGLADGAKLRFTVTEDGNILVLSHQPAVQPMPEQAPPPSGLPTQTVFQKKALKHIHIEPFRPENLETWGPETETDVYLAFGVLQEFTDFQYCCGASKAILTKLGASYDDSTKPDAILIDRVTGEYVMAEWKKRSSEFKQNHSPEDVDVLVCWHDDETDRGTLPPRVLAIHGVAKQAAETALKSL